MKLLALTLVALCVLGAVVAEPDSAATPAPATSADSTPMTPQPTMESEMEADPIYQEYINKARELYVKALTDYYHAHPDRLESDLSGLTSMEYENMVPSELLDTFNVDKAKIEAKIHENDINEMEDMDETEAEAEAEAEPEEAEHDTNNEDMQAMATDEDDEQNDMEIQQFRGGRGGRGGRVGGFGRVGRFGRFGRRWGYGRRIGWRRYGWGWGWRYPYYRYGGYWWGRRRWWLRRRWWWRRRWFRRGFRFRRGRGGRRRLLL